MKPKYNIEELNAFLDAKLVSYRVHPEYPDLWVLKYTPKAQYSREIYNNQELQKYRGMAIDTNTGEIVARGMKKFFNVEECTYEFIDSIWDDPCRELTEKIDGTCGLLTEYDGKQFIYTLGSFDSDQAQWANKLIEKYPYKEAFSQLDTKKYTYIFEIVYKDDQKVVDYGNFEGLYFLNMIDNETGQELLWCNEVMDKTGELLTNYNILTSYPYLQGITNTVAGLKALNLKNTEGFVLSGRNGRIKIKFDDYLQKFRTKFKFSNKEVFKYWAEYVLNGWNREEMAQKAFLSNKGLDEEMVIVALGLWDKWDSQADMLWYDAYCCYTHSNYDQLEPKQFVETVKDDLFKGAFYAWKFAEGDKQQRQLKKWIIYSIKSNKYNEISNEINNKTI